MLPKLRFSLDQLTQEDLQKVGNVVLKSMKATKSNVEFFDMMRRGG